MNIKVNDPFEMDLRGVYQIKNLLNGKIYVGSTIMSFKKRLWHHSCLLVKGNHKNIHLQNSWNKYGKGSFEFSILEVCIKEDCLTREQHWMDKLECINKEKGYNINPIASGTPNMSKETIEKRRQTMIKRYSSGDFDHMIEALKERGRLRKGKRLDSTDHLKVPKTISDKVIESRNLRVQRTRDTLREIYVYDKYYNFLGKWRSIPDLIEFSLSKDNNLPIETRFPIGRTFNGKIYPPKALREPNIHMGIKNQTLYKSLYFSYRPLHQVIDVEKSSKNGEVCEDNTVLNSGITRGSESV